MKIFIPPTPPDQREPSIFISHSSKDIVVARSVRNLLEDRNHNFVGLIGLASYTPDLEKEIFQLLENEVKARDWLLLIDSDNARSSPYVQFEIKTARTLEKPFYTVDCNRFMGKGDRYAIEDSLQPCITSFSRGLRLFASYSHKNKPNIYPIIESLRSRKFEVWADIDQVKPGEPWQEQIRRAIEYTAEQGIFLIFLTKESVQSQYIQEEIEYATKLGGLFLPILMERVQLPESISRIQYLDATKFNTHEEVTDVITDAINHLRHSQFNQHCGGSILNV